jgi:RNA 3'-terminal phosphate cyclase (ATP)
VPRLIPVDGSQGETSGQVLRTALCLAAATGQGFEMTRIRATRPRPGLRPQHVATVRAVALACGARVGGAFDGSPDLRFEPGALAPGDFRFELATSGAATLLLQTLLPALARGGGPSRVEATGGTHVPASPSFEFLASHWAESVEALGLPLSFSLVRAGFPPRGGGEIHARVAPWEPARKRSFDERGALLAIRGVSGAARLKGDVARRQSDAARALLWEQRRLEASWQVSESLPAGSPGSFLLLAAEFEGGRGAFGVVGERGLRPEVLGERAARRLLKFLDAEGALDPQLADQLAVPLALAGGGRLTTSEVTRHLETVAGTLGLFGVTARVTGARGTAGALELERC